MGLAWQNRLGTGFSMAEMIDTPVAGAAVCVHEECKERKD
jgi:hypothetical protein